MYSMHLHSLSLFKLPCLSFALWLLFGATQCMDSGEDPVTRRSHSLAKGVANHSGTPTQRVHTSPPVYKSCGAVRGVSFKINFLDGSGAY